MKLLLRIKAVCLVKDEITFPLRARDSFTPFENHHVGTPISLIHTLPLILKQHVNVVVY